MDVDNFDVILNMLSFDSKDDFYFVELIKRKKDNNPDTQSQKLIEWFEFNSKEKLISMKQYIHDKCVSENCRAYIRLNKRDKKQVALQVLREISNRVANSDYNIKNVYHQVLGRYHNDKNKKWIIDIDGDDIEKIDDIYLFFSNLRTKYVLPDTMVHALIPTKNGIHIITSPFDSKLFNDIFPDISIHKDNPTLLMYIDNNKT